MGLRAAEAGVQPRRALGRPLRALRRRHRPRRRPRTRAAICSRTRRSPRRISPPTRPARRGYYEALYAERPEPRVRAALERLYERQGRHRALVDLLSAELGAQEGEAAQKLRARIAELWLDGVGEAEPAVAIVEQMLDAEPGGAEAFELLERVMAAIPAGGAAASARQRAAARLKERYRAQGRAEGSGARARDRPRRRDDAGRARRAPPRHRAAPAGQPARRGGRVRGDRGAARARARFGRAPRRARPPRRAPGKSRRASPRRSRRRRTRPSGASRIELLAQAAAVYEEKLHDTARAIDLHRAILGSASEPSTPVAHDAAVLAAARALDRLLAAAGRSAERGEVLERLAALEPSADARRAARQELAQLALATGDVDRAVRAFRASLADDPGDLAAEEGLVRALEAGGRWEELVAAAPRARGAQRRRRARAGRRRARGAAPRGADRGRGARPSTPGWRCAARSAPTTRAPTRWRAAGGRRALWRAVRAARGRGHGGRRRRARGRAMAADRRRPPRPDREPRRGGRGVRSRARAALGRRGDAARAGGAPRAARPRRGGDAPHARRGGLLALAGSTPPRTTTPPRSRSSSRASRRRAPTRSASRCSRRRRPSTSAARATPGARSTPSSGPSPSRRARRSPSSSCGWPTPPIAWGAAPEAARWERLASALAAGLAERADVPRTVKRQLLHRVALWHQARGDAAAAEAALVQALALDPESEPLLSALADGAAARAGPGARRDAAPARGRERARRRVRVPARGGRGRRGPAGDPALARDAGGEAPRRRGRRLLRARARAPPPRGRSRRSSRLAPTPEAKSELFLRGARLPFDAGERRRLRLDAAELASGEAAIAVYEELFAEDPRDPAASERLYAIYRELGRRAALVALRERQIAALPDGAERLDLRLDLAGLRAEEGDREGAIAALRENLAGGAARAVDGEARRALCGGRTRRGAALAPRGARRAGGARRRSPARRWRSGRAPPRSQKGSATRSGPSRRTGARRPSARATRTRRSRGSSPRAGITPRPPRCWSASAIAYRWAAGFAGGDRRAGAPPRGGAQGRGPTGGREGAARARGAG